MQWFVLKVTTNREKSIRQSLLRRIAREGLDEFFTEVIIPTENVVETKAGKKKVSEQKLFPGYLFVQMVLNDETWYLVRGTSGIGDFTGAGGKPVAMSDEEVSRMLGRKRRRRPNRRGSRSIFRPEMWSRSKMVPSRVSRARSTRLMKRAARFRS
ncbi:MAG: hypothetical protein CM1200mP2_00250 [Planctomycetaceae bacterium]|nr:MAG: hypothetical protein CM1200mP2_00250 [Planctomycetaceae bacterium]